MTKIITLTKPKERKQYIRCFLPSKYGNYIVLYFDTFTNQILEAQKHKSPRVLPSSRTVYSGIKKRIM